MDLDALNFLAIFFDGALVCIWVQAIFAVTVRMGERCLTRFFLEKVKERGSDK